jgi:large conductance mechanosensitive channel
MSLGSEFKAFAMRGNVVDLAVGVIIGSAFTVIVTSFANDIITPPLGLLFGNTDFKDYYLVLRGGGPYPSLAAAQQAGAVTLNYGLFINAIIKFLIVAAALFLMLRQINRLIGAKPPATEAPPPPAEDIVLLREIRDALRTRNA